MAEAEEADDDDEPVFDGDEFLFDSDEFDLLRSSTKKLSNLKKALKTWDEHEGDGADGCNSEVATKREGSPSQIRAAQEADHLEAALKDIVDICRKPRLFDEARPNKAHSKSMRRKVEREYM